MTGSASAQNWAEDMFQIKSHNFGKVPLQSDSQYHFVFKNNQKSDIHIASVSSSCSCTEPSFTKQTIKSGEMGEIIAKVNTTGQHIGKRSATLTVRFDRPSEAYVQLEVSVYIRQDIVLNPGTVDFGAVREGKSVARVVKLQYAGNPDWRLLEIKRNNSYISARAVPIESEGNSREVTYEITVTLSEKAPPGYIRDSLRFITNEGVLDSKGQKTSHAIELPVNGVVMDPLVAKPSPFQFGSISPGETVTKYLVLRAAQAFHVLKVSSSDPRFRFSPSEQFSNIHIIAVTLSSHQGKAEQISRIIKVHTDLKEQDDLLIDVHARFLSEAEVDSKAFYTADWKSGGEETTNTVEPAAVKKRTPKSISLNDQTWDDIPVDESTLEEDSLFSTEKPSESNKPVAPEKSPPPPESGKEESADPFSEADPLSKAAIDDERPAEKRARSIIVATEDESETEQSESVPQVTESGTRDSEADLWESSNPHETRSARSEFRGTPVLIELSELNSPASEETFSAKKSNGVRFGSPQNVAQKPKRELLQEEEMIGEMYVENDIFQKPIPEPVIKSELPKTTVPPFLANSKTESPLPETAVQTPAEKQPAKKTPTERHLAMTELRPEKTEVRSPISEKTKTKVSKVVMPKTEAPRPLRSSPEPAVQKTRTTEIKAQSPNHRPATIPKL